MKKIKFTHLLCKELLIVQKELVTRLGLQCQTPLWSYPLSLILFPLSLIPTLCSLFPSTVPFKNLGEGYLERLFSVLG